MAAEAVATQMADDEKGRKSAAKRWRFLPLLLIVAGLGFGYAMGWHRYLTLDFLAESRLALKAFVSANPVAAPIGFMLLYAVAVAFSFPAASVLTIFSGFLFGWLYGALLAILGATAGATALFLAARTAFGGFLTRRAGKVAAGLSDGFERDAFGYLLVLRIAPFIPFFIVNIAPALFQVRVRTFIAATLIGIVPGAFAYAWLGQGVDSVHVAARQSGREVAVGDLVTPEITIAFAALALVAALAIVVKKFWSRPA